MTTINLQDLESKVEAPSEADKLEQQLVDDLPEKYRGKTIKEVAKMHEEAEKAMSRQGVELGEVRKLADTLIGLEQGKKVKEEETVTRTPVTTEELFSDTDTTITRAVEQNPVVQRAVTTAENLERELNTRKFESEFPNYKDDLVDPAFAEWVKKSPVRVNLAIASDQYNLEAARGLWQMWGEYKEITGSAAAQAEEQVKKNEAKSKREKALEDADLEGGVTGDGSTDAIYDRRKVMDLRIRALRGDKAAEAKLKKLNPLRVYSEKRIR